MAGDIITYAFANARDIQRERLRLLSELLDAGTFRLLRERGVMTGWRCLEVGAGGGSVAGWLCGVVGPSGSVLATDLDTSVLREFQLDNLQVLTHDLLVDDLTEGEFDLVHARLLLAWLAEPQRGLERMVATLKAGGCLLVEEMDFHTVVPDPRLDRASSELFSRAIEAHHLVLARHHSFDPFYGRRLAGALTAAGLADVSSEGRVSMWHGGGPGGAAWQLTFVQLREPMIETGLITAADFESIIELCGNPKLSFMSQVTMAAWGCRPAV
jgi:SAM-dependent methyltransferase